MIEAIKRSRLSQFKSQLVNKFKQYPIFALAMLVSLGAVIYWGSIASDRYVSEAHVIIQRTDLAGGQTVDFSSLIGNVNGGGHADQLLLRDHLRSIDMLKKLDSKLQLRAHFSEGTRDPLSRMWFEDESIEKFHEYYLSRVSIELDDYTGVLIVKAQAYEAKMAQAIAATLVEEGERFMNQLAHSLAENQVRFLQQQVEIMNARTTDARQAVLQFQNAKGLVSPEGTAENLATIIGRLEGQLTELQTRRAGMLGYLMPDSPNIVELNLQIAAIEKQISQERARLASPHGKTLNRTVEEFQRLQMNAKFADDVYKTALVALEKGRIEATRTIKKLSVLQSPTLPEYSLEPRRLYNTAVVILIALLVAGVAHLLLAVVRDHQE